MSKDFNFEEALATLRNGQDLTGKDGILTPHIKQLAIYFEGRLDNVLDI